MPASVTTTRSRSSPVISPNATAVCGPPNTGPSSRNLNSNQKSYQFPAERSRYGKYYTQNSAIDVLARFDNMVRMNSIHNNNNNNLNGMSAAHYSNPLQTSEQKSSAFTRKELGKVYGIVCT